MDDILRRVGEIESLGGESPSVIIPALFWEKLLANGIDPKRYELPVEIDFGPLNHRDLDNNNGNISTSNNSNIDSNGMDHATNSKDIDKRYFPGLLLKNKDDGMLRKRQRCQWVSIPKWVIESFNESNSIGDDGNNNNNNSDESNNNDTITTDDKIQGNNEKYTPNASTIDIKINSDNIVINNGINNNNNEPLGRKDIRLGTDGVCISFKSFVIIADFIANASDGKGLSVLGEIMWRRGTPKNVDPCLSSITVVPIIPSSHGSYSTEKAYNDGNNNNNNNNNNNSEKGGHHHSIGEKSSGHNNIYGNVNDHAINMNINSNNTMSFSPDFSSAVVVHASHSERISDVLQRSIPSEDEWPLNVTVRVNPIGWMMANSCDNASNNGDNDNGHNDSNGYGGEKKKKNIVVKAAGDPTIKEAGFCKYDTITVFVKLIFDVRPKLPKNRSHSLINSDIHRGKMSLTKHRAGKGIRNLGATCHLAAVIQALRVVLNMNMIGNSSASPMTFSRTITGMAIRSLVNSINGDNNNSNNNNNRKITSGDPTALARSLSRRRFDPHRQQDAHECFMMLLDAAEPNVILSPPINHNDDDDDNNHNNDGNDSSGGNNDSNNNSSLTSLLTSWFTSKIECLGCGRVSSVTEPSIGVSVAINNPNSKQRTPTSLEDCAKLFSKREIFHAGPDRGSWCCESCGDAEASFAKSITLSHASNVFVVHLKRFDAASKITAKVDFDPNFPVDLASWFGDGSGTSGPDMYRCNAIVEHSGTRSFGHYTAAVRDGDSATNWIRFDDEHVSEIEDNIVTAKSYLFFMNKI